MAANVVAMEQAIAIGDGEPVLTPADILAIHRTLMAHEPARVMPGTFRREQSWIGGRLLNPSAARYVPPPEGDVERLILDLVAFMNRDASAMSQTHSSRSLIASRWRTRARDGSASVANRSATDRDPSRPRLRPRSGRIASGWRQSTSQRSGSIADANT